VLTSVKHSDSARELADAINNDSKEKHIKLKLYELHLAGTTYTQEEEDLL
jgi:hypothetical protein